MEFSWSAFGIGALILLAGGALTLWHRQIADAMGGSYTKYQMWGLITCLVGLLVMFNIYGIIINFVFGGLFHTST